MRFKFIYGKKSRIMDIKFFLIFMFLVLAILPFSSPAGEPFSITESEQYKLTFEFSELGLTHKCLDISIQNKQTGDNQYELNIKSILNETDFDLIKLDNVVFSIYKTDLIKNVTKENISTCYSLINQTFNYTDLECNANNSCSWSTNGTNSSCACEFNSSYSCVLNTYQEEITYSGYEERPILKTDKENKVEFMDSGENIFIKKAGHPDGDTAKFRLCFDTPIVTRSDGWGNAGTVYLDVNGITFVDKTSSSWWNSTYTKKLPLNCTNMDNKVPIVINGSNGFNPDGSHKQIVWTYCSGTGTALYMHNSTDWSAYVVANDTTQLPMEVESGNATSYNPTQVWDANYKLVYHLGELTGTNVTDSTSNNNHGVLTGGVLQGTGKFGYGYTFSDDYITRALSGSTPFTHEVWYYNTYTGAENQFLYGKDGNADFRGWISFGDDSSWHNYGGITTNVGTFPVNNWRNALFTTNGTTGKSNLLYIDGILNGTVASTSTIYDYTWLGCGSNGLTYCDNFGIMDEVRISDVSRSASYSNQTYQNALGTSGYGNLLAEESYTPPNTAPTITANTTKPATVYTNTDWLLNITATDLENSSFTAYTQFYINGTSSGSELPFTISNNSNTNVANLSSTTFNKGATLIAEMWVSDVEYNSTKTNSTQVTVLNSVPTIQVQNTFINWSAGHTFNVTAGISDIDGGIDIIKTNISTSSGTCQHLVNSTTGNFFNVTYNCSGIALTSTNIIIGFNDSSGAYVSSTSSANTYPDQAPTDPTGLTGQPANLYVTDTLTMTASGGTDADSDSITYHYKFYNVNETNTRQNWSATNSYTIQTSDAHDTIRIYAKSTTTYANSSGSYSEDDFVDDTLSTTPTGSSLTAGDVKVTETLTGTGAGSTDADLDTITYHYQFNNTNDSVERQAKSSDNTYIIAVADAHDNIRVRIWATTVYGDSATYEELNKQIANTAPTTPTLTNPTNNAYINTIMMNWTASTDADSDSINYYVLVNGTQACYTTNLNCSYDPANAYYQWNVTPYDGTVNGTTSASRYYTYDTTSPVISIVYPLVTTYAENVSNLKYTVTEVNPAFCWYSRDSGVTNSSAESSGTNFTHLTSVANSNTWIVYCNDTSSNVGSDSITFNVTEIWYNTNYPFANKSFRITEFINVSGTSFTLVGEPYTFLGVDSYYLADYATNHTYDDDGNEINNSRQAVLEILNEAQYLNINVIRTWAGMQGGEGSHWEVNKSGGHWNLFEVNEPGNYSEEMFASLDWVIYEASKRDIRLQLVLVNNWNDYGGMRWYAQMSPTTNKTYENISDYSDNNYWLFHDQFYTDDNCQQYYKNYINHTLLRNNTYSGLQYKDDPAIFGWLLANEPRAKSDGTGRGLIRNWTTNMTAYIKTIDTNHLVGLGIEGWGYVETWGEGTDMIADHNGTGVDYATYAIHPDQWQYFAERSEHSNGSWVTENSSTNAFIDWWTNDTNISYNNRYATDYIPAYTPALARYGYDNWVEQNVEWANNLNMPVLLQEAGYLTNHAKVIKDRFYEQMIHNFYNRGGDGLMFWTLNHDDYYYSTGVDGVMDDGYGFYVSDDTFLRNKSESVMDAIDFTKTDNSGASWITELNSYKYHFVVSVGTASDKTVANATLHLNISNGTTWRIVSQVNSSTITSNEIYIFVRQFNDTDEEAYWFTEVCSTPSLCINSTSTYIQIKTGTPDITLLYPEDDGYYNNPTLDFNYTVTETNGLEISNCELYINGSLNKTDNTITRVITQTFTVSSLTDNVYSWYIRCTDTDNNVNNSVTRGFTYDITNPSLSITTSNNTISNTLTTIEGTASDTYPDSIYSNNTAWTWNGTYTNWKFTNNTNVNDGVYHILITANDSAGNTASSLFNFTYDTTIPTPSNIGKNTTPKINEDVLFYTQWSDTNGLSHYIFSWNHSGGWVNDSAVSLTSWSNVTKTITATGKPEINWKIYANDSVGNINDTGVQTFTISNTAPVITTTQTTVSQNTSSTYTYDYNGTDADLDTLTWSDNTTLFNINSGTGIITDTPTEDETGTYTILITLSDGTDTDTDTFDYTISDTTNPTYSSLANNGTTAKVGTDVNWSVTLSDGYQLDYYIFSYNDSGSWVNDSTVDISGTSYFTNVTKTITSTQGKSVCGKFYFNDTSSNENITSNSCFTVVNTAPTQPSLTNPSNDSYINSVTLNWTASTDADGDTINYYVLLNGSQICYTADLNCSNVTSDNFYLWNVTAFDGTENTTSLTRQFTYDTTNPLISFDTGTLANNSYRNQNYIFANWTFTEINLMNITARLYNSTPSLINTTTFLTSTYEINWTGLTEQAYYYNLTIYDNATNYNETETRKITLDSSNPSISSVTVSGITQNDATVSFTTNEVCNFSIIYGFATDSMPYSVRSNTFTTSHSPTFSTLLTYDRTYFFNLTVWDNTGNSDTDNNNNFTTLDKQATGTGSGDTGLPSEEDEPEPIVEPTVIYVNTTDADLIEKLFAYLSLKEKTGFGEKIDERFTSKTSNFNSFIMEIRTLKEWKREKGTSVYITLTDLTGNKIDVEKISVKIRDGDGNLIDSSKEVKKINLGNYIAILKVDEENELGSYFVEVDTYYKGELGSDVLTVEVEESEISILTKILNFLKRIWEALTKFKIVAPEDSTTPDFNETSYINQSFEINQTINETNSTN